MGQAFKQCMSWRRLVASALQHINSHTTHHSVILLLSGVGHIIGNCYVRLLLRLQARDITLITQYWHKQWLEVFLWWKEQVCWRTWTWSNCSDNRIILVFICVPALTFLHWFYATGCDVWKGLKYIKATKPHSNKMGRDMRGCGSVESSRKLLNGPLRLFHQLLLSGICFFLMDEKSF